MCTTCGCAITSGNADRARADAAYPTGHRDRHTVNVLESLLSANDRQAHHNRAHFAQHHVLAVNLMSSPGAGKTALLEATIERLKTEMRILVIEGDLETENDAERIRKKGVPALQITTGSACHLDAHLVHETLHHVDLAAFDVVLIENVGNLVCPASFDLGQQRNVVLLSTTEGDDKPAKYPVMFRAADLVLLSKCDLLPVLDDFDTGRAEAHVRALASAVPILPVSAKSGMGVDAWCDWLRARQAEIVGTPGRYRRVGISRPHRSVLAQTASVGTAKVRMEIRPGEQSHGV